MFTHFTDRDGKFQLCALTELAFDPLARTTRFMLMKQAHYMYVGEPGVARVIRRTCESDAGAQNRRSPKSARIRRGGSAGDPTLCEFPHGYKVRSEKQRSPDPGNLLNLLWVVRMTE
jgi:benzoyl-CoA 2,3-dioxygenase component B